MIKLPFDEDTLTERDFGILRLMVTISGSLSIVGCLFIIMSYLKFREFKQFHLRLILYLSVADLGWSITTIFGSHSRVVHGSVACTISGAFLEFYCLASILWTGCIAHTLYHVIGLNNDNVERYEMFYHLFCWGIPIVFDVILYMFNKFADAGLWCWVENGLDRYYFFYGPLLAILCYNFVTYILVSKKLHKERKRIRTIIEDKPKNYSIESTFRYFLLVLVFCWVPALVNRVQNSLYPNKPLFVLYALQACLTPLQGFLNSVIYGFNDELRTKLVETWKKWKGKMFPKAHYMSIQDDEQWSKHYKETMREYDEEN